MELKEHVGQQWYPNYGSPLKGELNKIFLFLVS